MKGIGGNILALIQTSTATRNEIGETVLEWNTVQTIKGWLDLASGIPPIRPRCRNLPMCSLQIMSPLLTAYRLKTAA